MTDPNTAQHRDPHGYAIVTLICWHEGLTDDEAFKVWAHLVTSGAPALDIPAEVRSAISALGLNTA